MFELEDLFDLTVKGAFANKEEFLEFAKDANPDDLFSLIAPGAFKDSAELSSLLKKKDDSEAISTEEPVVSVTPTQEEPGLLDFSQEQTLDNQIVIEEQPQPDKPLAGKTSKDFELVETEPQTIEGVEASVAENMGIDINDYNQWKEENLRPESSTYRFFKNLLLTKDGEQFEVEEKANQRFNSYLASKLNKRLEEAETSQDVVAIEQLKEQNKKDREILLNNLKTYKKETVEDERKEREQLNNALNSPDLRMQLGATLWEAIKGGANAASRFSTGTFASVAADIDATLASGGADKKGFWAGVSEMFLDAGQAWDLDLGETKRPMIIEGKKVTYRGKEYLVNEDNIIYDYDTNIRVDDFIGKEAVSDILRKASTIEETEREVDMGAALTGITGQLVNLYGLIRTGRGLRKIIPGLGPRGGMALSTYLSSVAGSINEVKDDLMAQGMDEKTATQIGLGAGNVIASLDAGFSALAGSNEKLLGINDGIKQTVLNIAKKEGKDFSRQQFRQKVKDFVLENLKEVGLEELPVLFSEKGINYLINQATGLQARDQEITMNEVFETIILTVGATSGLGSVGLLGSNDRNDALRSIASSNLDVTTAANNLVKEGLLTQKEADKVINEVNQIKLAENKTGGVIKMTDNMMEAADLITEKEKLVQQREAVDPSLRADIDAKIEAIDQRIQKLKEKDAQNTEAAVVKVTREEALQA